MTTGPRLTCPTCGPSRPLTRTGDEYACGCCHEFFSLTDIDASSAYRQAFIDGDDVAEGVRKIVTLGDAFPEQQARLRELLGLYKGIGPAGVFGVAMIEDCLRRADRAAIEGDVVAMVQLFDEMKGFKE
jgi:hypothetical protein